MHRELRVCLLVLATFLAPLSGAAARELSIPERIEAQRAIERVYYAHRAWPADNPSAKPAFETVLDDRALAARVEGYLAKSVALETSLSHPITAPDLQAELDRMARDTRDPGLLRELFDALGNDPFVIAETLARQNLAGTSPRVERNGTTSIELRATAGPYVLPTIGTGPAIVSTAPAARFGQTSVWTGSAMIVWGSEDFANTGAIYDPALDVWTPTATTAGVPTGRGRHSAVWTGSEMIVWGGLTAGGETNTGARYVPATDSWIPTSTGPNCPTARQRHTAVWTGSQMIVFGGSAGSTYYNTGGIYDPGTDSWTPTSTGASVPSIRDQHTAVWTGTQMIVWGGSDSAVRLNTGSRYTPATDSWTALPTGTAPAARIRHTAVWTGSVMIVWGGFAPPYLNSGSRYNPTINAWSTTSPTNAPSIRGGHTAVWTGSEMIVWGGQNATVALDNGGRYNPTSNLWTAVASGGGAPAARYGHSAAYFQGQMIVWGGNSGTSTLDTGGLYDSFASTWRDTTTSLPGIRFHPRAAAKPVGAPAIFTVMARGDAPLTYRWRKGGVDMSDGPGVSGTGTDTLKLSQVKPSDAAIYSVRVGNGSGTAVSNDAALTVNAPQPGDLDVSFKKRPGLDSYPTTVVAQSDGKLIVTGYFATVYGAARGRIARLNADGSNDDTFMNGLTGADDSIWDVAIQPDGKILIVGTFTEVNGVPRGGIARLNADGSLDSSFLNGMSGGGSVYTVSIASDGKIVAAGFFQSFNGASGWNSIVRLNPDGSLDNTWVHGFGMGDNDGYLLTTLVQPDGKVLVGGRFATFNNSPRGFLTRLNADGTTDASFQNGMAGADWDVKNFALSPDGHITVAGNFGTMNGVSRTGFARLNTDGSLDASFPGSSGPDSYTENMATQPDGKIVIAGYFTSVDGAPRSGIARLNRDGTLDASFQNGMSGLGGGYALSVSVAPDGHVAIVGAFESVNGVPRSSVAKLNPDGSLDAAFEHPAPSVDGSVEQSLQLPDGRIVVGGSFAQLDGAAGRGIARLLQDGSVDPNFHGAVDDGSVGPFARQPDGRLVVTGSFTSIGGVSRNRIARLEADGSLDTSFQNGMAGLDQPATAVVLQPDGRILVGGSFTTVNGVSRTDLARLNADGSMDSGFQPNIAPAPDYTNIRAIALQPDGRIVIGGDLSTVGGVARARVARLNADGSLDPTFGNAAVYAYGVTAIAVQPDGRIVIGGEFESVAGVPRGKVARLNADGTLDASFQNGMSGLATAFGTDLGAWASSLALMADGRVLVGGKFQRVNGAPRSGIARLNADGSLDVTFQNGMPGADGRYSVDHVSEQSDGRVLVAGRMSTMNLENTGPIARVYGTAPVAPAITTQPANQVSYEGSCAVFHVGASGTPVDYRWRKGGVDLVESATVSGTKSSTLTLTGVTAASAGSYDVVIGNVLGTESSMTVTLTVDPVPECRVATCDAELGSVLVVASPPEITALRIDGHSPSSLGWSDPGGAVFDVVSSTLGDLRTSGTTGATCLANDVATAGYSDTQPNPSAGNGYYYLVRAQSSCGSGNYGSDSAGVPRAPVAACP